MMTWTILIELAHKKIDALVTAYSGYSQFGVEEIIKAAMGYRRNGSSHLPDSIMKDNAMVLCQEMLRHYYNSTHDNWMEDQHSAQQFSEDYAKVMEAFGM